jgi:hypothetical protein
MTLLDMIKTTGHIVDWTPVEFETDRTIAGRFIVGLQSNARHRCA